MASPPSPLPTYLYKILPSAPPSPLPASLPLSDLDANDGFIHLSTAAQVPGTAAAFFGGFEELWLLKVSYLPGSSSTEGGQGKTSGEVRWEEVTVGNGEVKVFPHLFDGALGKGNVVDVLRVERGSGWEGLVVE